MKKYDSYKDSGIGWLGEIPEHWEQKRLKDISNLQFSNVDKKVKEDQNKVFLCNYVDVYKNDFISNRLDFMPSTASYSEIKRFKVKKGDILCTKDSESFDDIANSALVVEDLNDIICGYHLAQIRANNDLLNPSFLHRLFQAVNYNYWFSINAKGITRVGLSISSFTNAMTPIPPQKEQTAIAQYLDTKTQAIDKKINILEQKITHYKDFRKSLINQVVTKGLNKNVKLKDSGFGFKVNENWITHRLKNLGNLFSGLSGKSGNDFNQYDNDNNKGFIPFTNIANNTYLKKNDLGTVVIEEGEKQNTVKKGDIFFLMSSEGYEDIGKTAVLAEDIEETYLNSFCKGFRVNQNKCNPFFLNYLMLSDYYRQTLLIQGKGFTRINLKMEKINDFEVYIPDRLSEQEEIVNYLDTKINVITSIISNIESQITTLKELRKTLINDVVTGKINILNN